MRTSALLGASVLFFINNAQAEDASEFKEEQTIESITVYAQKRAQDIRDISVSVSALDEELLRQLDIKDSTELSAQIPNAKITANTGEGAPPIINIRGVASLDYNNTTTAPVGVYVDNVVGGALSNSLLYLFDIEQIELLKGPQGTLFGRNTNGGALLIQSKRPEFEFGGYATLGVANQDHQKQEIIVNTPINETTAVRAGFSRQDYDYSSINLNPEAPQAGMRQNNYRVSLLHQADDYEIYFKLYGADWDGLVKPPRNKGFFIDGMPGCPPDLAGTQRCTDAFGFNIADNDPQAVNTEGDAPHNTEKTGATLQWQWQINDRYFIKSITAFGELDRLHTFDCDNSPFNRCYGDLGVDNELFTQELQLHTQFGEHYLISGIFYINESIIQDNQIDLFRDFRPVLAAGPAHFFYDNTVDIESIAAFAQLDYQLNESLMLTAGLRYTDESTDYRATSDINVPLFVGDLQGTTIEGWDFSGQQNDSKLSGKLALVQTINDNVNLFYSLSKGFKSGGYNGGLAFTPDEARLAQYGPESLLAYEVGSKMQFQNSRINLAAFYYDYDNQQIFMNQQSNQALSAPAQVLDNVGESTIYGFEVELAHNLTNSIFLQFGAGYIPKAELKEFEDIQGNTIRDHRLPYTSKLNLNGLANYSKSLSKGEFVAQIEFDYQSDFYFDQNENPLAEQGDFTVWNARVSYQHQEQLEIALWVKNLTDEEYSHIIFDMGEAFGLLQDLKAEARRYGASVTYYF